VLQVSNLKIAPTELSLSPVVYNDVGFAPGWHEYPLHTSLARRASTVNVRAGGADPPAAAGMSPVGLRFQGPKARCIPAWRDAPVQSMFALAARTHLQPQVCHLSDCVSRGRRPASYQPGATRQVQGWQCFRGL